ncbi:NACHT domain-containing NTPase [Gordonia sp. ABKF26]|uniref:NACHT domain-containing protein n=1 Tax=Gordonia sp. ABKF26 TaxID=3238687 RepID=UPI0034E42FC4
MTYDFSRLGPDGFEQLVQALALASVGGQVRIFGDGRDGGREATFVGECHVLGGGDWDGYGVIQAKFKSRITSTGADQSWFFSEATKELDAWVGRGRKTRRVPPPEYLVFATNVVLTPANQNGGADRFERLMMEYRDLTDHGKPPQKVGLPGLKGWAAWHPDQLTALLDNYPAVRHRFADLIMPGDVLSRLFDHVAEQDARISQTLVTHLVQTLKADLMVELGESGDQSSQRLRLEQVAVDLPAQFGPSGSTSERDMVLHRIISDADHVRDPEFGLTSNAQIIVLGGPGTGKTTLSRTLCQIYRAALLQGRNPVLTQQDAETAHRVWEAFTAHGLPTPRLHRFPVRVVLSEFADALSADRTLTMLQHITNVINRRQSDPLNITDAKLLFARWPILVVLDGLDEVAAANDRHLTNELIDDFRAELAAQRVDALIVCTTRPTGYTFDGSSGFELAHLSRLTRGEALDYASRLLQTRFPADEDRQDKVMTRVRRAADEPETARLMTTPLQVTIVALLLEQRTRAPHSRFALFNAYYETIYARERNKHPTADLLFERYQHQLDRIHQQCALTIHVQAEQSGDAESILAKELLSDITTRVIDSDGYTGEEAHRMATQIDELATTRLVLIVPRGEGVAFEVRTLTEFFAAKRLMQSSDPSDILEALIPSAHWRHTWLLAAGLVFHERPYQRDMVLNRLNSIDQQTAVNRLVQPGALAAVNALLDGFAANTPRWQRDFARSALRLVDGPSGKHIEDLSDALVSLMPDDATLSEVVWDELDRRLRTSFAGAARTLLILLAQAPDALGVHAQRRIDQYAVSGDRAKRATKKPTISTSFMTDAVDAVCRAYGHTRSEDLEADWQNVLDMAATALSGTGGGDATIEGVREIVCRGAAADDDAATVIRPRIAEALLLDRVGHRIADLAGIMEP